MCDPEVFMRYPAEAFKCKTLKKVDSILDDLRMEGARNKTLDMVMNDLLDRLNKLEGFDGIADTVKMIINLPGYKLVKQEKSENTTTTAINPCYEAHLLNELRKNK